MPAEKELRALSPLPELAKFASFLLPQPKQDISDKC
jgi:hypothetical protein